KTASERRLLANFLFLNRALVVNACDISISIQKSAGSCTLSTSALGHCRVPKVNVTLKCINDSLDNIATYVRYIAADFSGTAGRKCSRWKIETLSSNRRVGKASKLGHSQIDSVAEVCRGARMALCALIWCERAG